MKELDIDRKVADIKLAEWMKRKLGSIKPKQPEQPEQDEIEIKR